MTLRTPSRTLVTGGSRSGKSSYAEFLAAGMSLEVRYIATAMSRDEEMRRRIDKHRKDRPGAWVTVEEPVSLGRALREHGAPGRCLLIDCITLWLSNVLGLADAPPDLPTGAEPPLRLDRLQQERDDLLAALGECPSPVIIVTNELGSGVVPLGRLSRTFVDEHGWTNQRLAHACDRVVLTVSGVPVTIKPAHAPALSAFQAG